MPPRTNTHTHTHWEKAACLCNCIMEGTAAVVVYNRYHIGHLSTIQVFCQQPQILPITRRTHVSVPSPPLPPRPPPIRHGNTNCNCFPTARVAMGPLLITRGPPHVISPIKRINAVSGQTNTGWRACGGRSNDFLKNYTWPYFLKQLGGRQQFVI